MAVPETVARKRLQVTGVVQGVGFRPFVYRLARLHHLSGWVCNTSRCVELEIEGPPASLASFIDRLEHEAPALARIDAVVSRDAPPQGDAGFAIRESQQVPATEALIPADVATCDACLADISDPENRRYRYAFTNCTDCGPRFTLIRQVPYDRRQTTMARFEMCPRCRAEYENPEDRRFHAEPTACPVCGPRVWLEAGGRRLDEDAIPAAGRLLHDGKIVAVKGLGGFHLAADARRDDAVLALRARKGRVAKPFAVMVRDLAAAQRLCRLGDQDRSLLLSRERPIVLASKRRDCPLSPHVAPGHKFLGLMLPYTPLHFLLLEHAPAALVMTSGNLSEEPLVYDNDTALSKLAGLADAFLLHDRDIQVACDDSVVRPVSASAAIPLRRARGLVPGPIYLPLDTEPILGVGAEQKNTFCVAAHGVAILSQHIGDLDSAETFDYYQQAIAHFKGLCRQDPAIVAHDLHPLYLSTRYAQGLAGVRLVGVQHHHAHIAACLAENRRTGRAIGLALDGTGYGPDGSIWGGELLVADLAGYTRAGHFAQVRLPGGDAAVKDPGRMAAAYLYALFGDDFLTQARRLGLTFSPLAERILGRQLAEGLHSPLTSSAGRLFDAVAGALGICRTRTYEGQPAMELEMAAAEDAEGSYPASIQTAGDLLIPDTLAVFGGVLADYHAGVDPAAIAGRFHNSVVRLLADACKLLRDRTGLNTVVLSGGAFQNALLFTGLKHTLEAQGFEVLSHTLTPPNDGSIALGQVAVAAARLKREYMK
ncbi:MAG: carbamoyltransferase HypF [Syntrophobacterales bacterium]|jgi:hydrogenase maturation protein HypF|nr:carbamoyltransferase HypF [Syntrophobacterales bacterium]